MRLIHFSTILLVLLPACVNGPGSAEDVYLAVGGMWTVDPDSLCGHCFWDEIDEVRDVFPEVEGIVEITDIAPTTFTMKGLQQGDTLVTIMGRDNGSEVVERYANVIVRHVNRFNFARRCNVREPSKGPIIVPPDSELYVSWSMSDNRYNSLAGHPEFELGDIEALELNLAHDSMTLKMPGEPGTTKITSPLFDGTVATIEVHEPGDFDGFEAGTLWDMPFEVDHRHFLQSAMLVNGRPVCLDYEKRVAEVLTPETCEFSNNALVTEYEEPNIWVEGTTEGQCTVKISVPAYGFSDTVSFELVPAFDTDESSGGV